MKKHKMENHNHSSDLPEEVETGNPEPADTAANADPEVWDNPGEVGESAPAAAEAVAAPPEELLKAEVADLKDKLLRKEADYQNYRKRMTREVGDARRIGLCETIVPFLHLFDLYAMAMKAADQSDNVAALKQGMLMIQSEYQKALDELGVKQFSAEGAKFDPALHDAVSYEASATVPEGMVLKQWNCGYKLGDRLLRPARVVVSSGPEAKGKDEA